MWRNALHQNSSQRARVPHSRGGGRYSSLSLSPSLSLVTSEGSNLLHLLLLWHSRFALCWLSAYCCVRITYTLCIYVILCAVFVYICNTLCRGQGCSNIIPPTSHQPSPIFVLMVDQPFGLSSSSNLLGTQPQRTGLSASVRAELHGQRCAPDQSRRTQLPTCLAPLAKKGQKWKMSRPGLCGISSMCKPKLRFEHNIWDLELMGQLPCFATTN